MNLAWACVSTRCWSDNAMTNPLYWWPARNSPDSWVLLLKRKAEELKMKSKRVGGEIHARNHPWSKTHGTLLLSMTLAISSDRTYSRKIALVYEGSCSLNQYLTISSNTYVRGTHVLDTCSTQLILSLINISTYQAICCLLWGCGYQLSHGRGTDHRLDCCYLLSGIQSKRNNI